jgi:hypothetical protein
MKNLIFILISVFICTVACKQKTTSEENPIQNNIEYADMIICQSCAMPLTDDIYGTNADGTTNTEYCKYCYERGQFVAPDLTVDCMIEICVSYMVEQGMPESNARILLQTYLPKLKRWQAQK